MRATLAEVKGSVSVKRATGDEWQVAVNGTVLYDDDKLRTERGGAAELRFPSGTVVVVSEDTLLGIAETRAAPGRPQTDVTVLRGAVDATLDRPANQSLTVGTPSATVRAGREIVFQ
ncbi:MAG TPA: FecR domain-containing protein [Myxococcaceae bacterium]|nr:FecR domain-containing protein [Myxococcaceae bacterium]